MLGKTMRIATLCTLALAICGERLKAENKEEKTSHLPRRWLAKSLLLGASVHAASGFVQPAHSATRFVRPAGVRTLEPLKGWKYVEECLLGVMSEEGEKLLDKIYDETSLVDNKALEAGMSGMSGDEWKALEDDVRKFKQRWLKEAQESYHKLRTPGEVHTFATLKDAMDDRFSDLLLAQRAVKKSQIWYVLDALEHGVFPYVDGILWKLYMPGTGAADVSWHPLGATLEERLQCMQGKDLQKLWLSTMLESAKHDERRDAEKLWLSTTSESAKRTAEKQKRDAEKWGEFE